MTELDRDALDIIFFKARTRKGWHDKPLAEGLLRKIYDAAIMGPTSLNSLPLRIVFVSSPASKERLRPALDPGNQPKMMEAPVTAIFAYDMRFYDLLAKTLPHVPDARSEFAGNDAVILETAFRNSTLQAAYFMIAARAHGLDCGPMSGFDQGKLNADFFPDGRYRSNFICNLGYGTEERLFPRSPRLSFEETCDII